MSSIAALHRHHANRSISNIVPDPETTKKASFLRAHNYWIGRKYTKEFVDNLYRLASGNLITAGQWNRLGDASKSWTDQSSVIRLLSRGKLSEDKKKYLILHGFWLGKNTGGGVVENLFKLYNDCKITAHEWNIKGKAEKPWNIQPNLFVPIVHKTKKKEVSSRNVHNVARNNASASAPIKINIQPHPIVPLRKAVQAKPVIPTPPASPTPMPTPKPAVSPANVVKLPTPVPMMPLASPSIRALSSVATGAITFDYVKILPFDDIEALEIKKGDMSAKDFFQYDPSSKKDQKYLEKILGKVPNNQAEFEDLKKVRLDQIESEIASKKRVEEDINKYHNSVKPLTHYDYDELIGFYKDLNSWEFNGDNAKKMQNIFGGVLIKDKKEFTKQKKVRGEELNFLIKQKLIVY